MELGQVSKICLNTFASHFGISVDSIIIEQINEQSINLNPPPGPGQVSTGSLSKCIVHITHSSIGHYKIYMRSNGKGNVFWKEM
jgi:hypothetical protein